MTEIPNINSVYTIRFWAPASSTYEAASVKLEMKAPELGNTRRVARNQSMQRTRAGSTITYDRGRNYDEIFTLQFRDMENAHRANLEAFLNAIQYGSTKIKYLDYMGQEFLGKIASTQLTFIDRGFRTHNNPYIANSLYDFDLDFLNLSDSTDDVEVAELPVSSALALHLTDFNHPHNPLTQVTVNIADGTKVIESISVDSFQSVHWIICVSKGQLRKTCIVHAAHNGSGVADATTLTVVESLGTDPSGVGAIVTLSADLNGAGTAQVMRLKAATTTDGYVVSCRRVKI